MPFDHAAAFYVVYQTSYSALVRRAALQPGEWLLVHGAAGGVGLSAVQIGKALGARVIATAGTPAEARDRAAVRRRRPHRLRQGGLGRAGEGSHGRRGADVVYDPVGGDVFDGSTKCIAFEGRILTIGFAGGRIPTLAINRVLLKNFSVVGVHWGYYQRRGSPLVQEWMDALLKLYADGRIRPVIYRAYPLREAAAALGALASRESYGKVVLVP